MTAHSKERYTTVEGQLDVSSLGRFSEGYQLHVCHSHQSPVHHQPHHQDSQYYKRGNLREGHNYIYVVVLIAVHN